MSVDKVCNRYGDEGEGYKDGNAQTDSGSDSFIVAGEYGQDDDDKVQLHTHKIEAYQKSPERAPNAIAKQAVIDGKVIEDYDV